ncbi:MAG TPA: translation initiation factor IF-2 [Candidatus Limnocylindrales bacterium]|nr:translation initiation factor IF-2 [Candidatus Limnocylindrales bacterium]
MQKIRINDLARELEVKSKMILDALIKVGVTEKKTHSSSIEVDEAERVKKYFAQHPEPGTTRASSRTSADEFKRKLDLSHISKPGDVLKAVTQRAAQPSAAARAATPSTLATPAGPRQTVAPPSAVRPATSVTKPVAQVASATPATPAEPSKPAPRFITPQSVARPPGIIVIPPKPPVAAPPATPPAHLSSASGTAQPSEPVVEDQIAALEESEAVPSTSEMIESEIPTAAEGEVPAALLEAPPAAERRAGVTRPAVPGQPGQGIGRAGLPTRPGQPGIAAHTPRRLIVPQTGPRPVYLAPPSAAPRAGASAPPRGGMPERGKPIFQRPRPGAPPQGQTRPPVRPGERRGPHPTRSGAPGTRPGFGAGAGVAPSPPTGQRPAGRPSRPGQRYVPRGVKEGPMKGFVPPPRLSLSSEPLPITRSITIPEGISVKDLAEKLGIRAKDLIARLLARGVFATVNQTLDSDLATDMARHFGAETAVITFEEQLAKDTVPAEGAGEERTAQGVVRPPVVTIMGHVDHGKTSLLDAIRSTNVAGGEAGGITQHIGAYKVAITDPNSPAFGREIVFLDTPGHEAFTRMRARGSKVTDIVVLVVAADDGVMPQTLEAIDHAKAANVPMIVAVNKIDKPEALPDRVKKQLADRGLMPEDWGGSTVFVDVSAKQKTNLNLLMEMICLVADLQDLKAVPDRLAQGTVLEAKLDRGRGPVATVLVQNGTLRTGDNFVVGNVFGRVRAMFNDRGAALDAATPATPVEILGLESLPQAGDQLVAVADREKARGISEYREGRAREAQLAKSSRVSLEGLAEQLKSAGQKELDIILKGDVQGSVEVLSDVLTKLSNDRVKIKILLSGVGAITETDVLLASASNAVIIGFNVRPERKAQELADQEKVDIRLHSIIYELADEIKRAMTGLLEPIIKEVYLGRADVRDTFRVPKVGMIAGCYVTDGVIKRDAEVRLLRDNVVVFKGKIGSVRRFKEDVSEVRHGMECGISIANYGDIKVGDVIEVFVTERVAAEAFV